VSDEGIAPPVDPGDELAPGYEAIEHMRRGNDLDVYDAWSAERATRCIVKALRPDRDIPRRREALLREGELLQRFTHPHIVRGYETLAEPQAMVVMETLTGATLAVEIAEGPEPELAEVAQLGLQLGSAVAYLHRHGILHLDLKPSNVIAEGGRAKLIDLSLAQPPGEAPPGLGTWLYLSPEQARGGELGPAADIWGLGVLLFAAAAGEGPFEDDPDASASLPSQTGSDEPDLRYPQLEGPVRRAGSLRPAIDPALDQLIADCLAPDPADRPSIAELMASLEGLAELPAGERRWSRGSSAAHASRR
jgi:serine/threonine protein kinase